jgi:S-DNA-T family DNA segregation ATPase FtsK/SpoIIIE
MPRLGLSPEKGNEIFGVLLYAVVILLTGSLLSYHPLDPSLLSNPGDGEAGTHNFVGPFGAQLAALCFALFGLTSFLLPLLLAMMAWRRLKGLETVDGTSRAVVLFALAPALPAMLQLLAPEVAWRGEILPTGGGIGVVVVRLLEDSLNRGGAFVVLLTILLVASSLALKTTFGDVLGIFREYFGEFRERLLLFLAQRHKRKQEKEAQHRVVRHVRASSSVATPRRPAAPGVRGTKVEQNQPHLPVPEAQITEPRLADLRVTERKGEGQFTVRKVRLEGAPAPVTPKAEPEQTAIPFAPEELEVSELPPINLLRMDPAERSHKEEELVRLGEVIRKSLEHFGIAGSIEGISPGPVITVYEFQPAPGIKVSRIINLQDDMALALKAEAVRIDRMPGRSTLGLEVPNEKRSIINLGHMLADEAFTNAPSVLTMALGADIYGRPVYADLATMPHLLVAGATGAGKSVGLQSMITSILYKATREDVQFIFIDPKRIELGVYADIPHLKTEVVMEPKKAANALRWAVSEMERRYRLLAEVHVRSIAFYNHAIRDPKMRQRLSLQEGDTEVNLDDLKPLPYYVIIIDELADLMMVASSDVETSIARLAQMARAVGIHLIVATQRPSVDVLTGTIKANFPCRLSFATAPRHDSRTILDAVGAEKLLGKGDALFIPPGTSRVQRLHGAYISEQETASLIRWLKRRGKPQLDLDVVNAVEETKESSAGGGGGDDELFDEAARLVVRERMASASFLQRRLRIGFSRAARIVDMMAADGLLGPAQGSKPREVLVKQDFFEEIDSAQADS